MNTNKTISEVDNMEYNYTKIDNEVMEQLMITKFNGTQYRILMKVIRSTAGFNKDSYDLSVGFITNAIGANKQQIKKQIKNLINQKVLKVEKKHTTTSSRVISLNKNYEEWIIDRYKEIDEYKETKNNKYPGIKSGTRAGFQNVKNTGSRLGTTSGNELDTQKEYIKNKIIKINIKHIIEIYNYSEGGIYVN